MDIEQFRAGWWSSPTSAVSLEMDEWLEQTFTEPFSFWNSLVDLQNSLSSRPVKSEFGKQYDFYYDLVIRHIESNPALTLIEESSFVQTWSFKRLQRLVNFQVKSWLKQSVKTGHLVVIMMPLGIHYTIALLTALRLGLKICFLPTSSRFLGKNHLRGLLDQIKPNVIISLPEVSLGLKDRFPEIFVDNLGEDDVNHEPVSFSYAAYETMQLSLALYRKQPYSVVPLDAHTTYLHALRDGLVALNLKPGTAHSTIHSCPIRSEPCSTLMTLLSGASLVHVKEESLSKDPTLLKNEKVHLLEVPQNHLKLWTKTPGAPKQMKGQYKAPWQHNHQAWQSYAELNKLEDVQAFHLLMDNSLGGILFFSKPTTKELDYFMKPSPGTPWSLKDINGSGEDSFKGFGIPSLQFSCKENLGVKSNFIVSCINKNCLVSGALLPCRDGVTVPVEKIENATTALPFVESSILYTFPEMGKIVDHYLILLVFVNPMKSDISEETKREWTEQIAFQIVDEVGAVFVPNRIEYYPLVPKMKGGAPDRNWCIDQFNRGFLSKKKNIQLYQVLSMLKKSMQ
jgi:hypothetical protein